MPCGRVHSACSVILAGPVLATGWYLGGPVLGAAAAFGCLCGILVTPDLDQIGVLTGEWWLIKYTMGLGFIWPAIWFPYARICPRHRCWFSHFPIIGTAGRLGYLAVELLVIRLFGVHLPHIGFGPIFFWSMGLFVSDFFHWFLDFHATMIPGLYKLTHPDKFLPHHAPATT